MQSIIYKKLKLISFYFQLVKFDFRTKWGKKVKNWSLLITNWFWWKKDANLKLAKVTPPTHPWVNIFETRFLEENSHRWWRTTLEGDSNKRLKGAKALMLSAEADLIEYQNYSKMHHRRISIQLSNFKSSKNKITN